MWVTGCSGDAQLYLIEIDGEEHELVSCLHAP